MARKYLPAEQGMTPTEMFLLWVLEAGGIVFYLPKNKILQHVIFRTIPCMYIFARSVFTLHLLIYATLSKKFRFWADSIRTNQRSAHTVGTERVECLSYYNEKSQFLVINTKFPTAAEKLKTFRDLFQSPLHAASVAEISRAFVNKLHKASTCVHNGAQPWRYTYERHCIQYISGMCWDKYFLSVCCFTCITLVSKVDPDLAPML